MNLPAMPEALRDAAVRCFPELADLPFAVADNGWHSVALDFGDRWICKFPRHVVAREALRREARLLEVIRPGIASLPVPDLLLVEGPPLFSRHAKLPGGHLTPEVYAALPDARREALAETLARFYRELHALEPARLREAGAGPVEPWQPLEAIRSRAVPALPASLQGRAQKMLEAWADLPPDEIGYGFFDGHGWNMAFDAGAGQLRGVYDFADSGFGPFHQEWIYSNFISRDLTRRLVGVYERLTGRSLDRGRIDLLTGIHRLSELAELADDPVHRPTMIAHALQWMEGGV